MEAALALISHLKCHIVPQALLDRRAPLLDVLRGRVRIERREAHHRAPQHRLREIEAVQMLQDYTPLPNMENGMMRAVQY